jgi:hypothetical protein
MACTRLVYSSRPSDDGMAAGRDGIVLAVGAHDGRLGEHQVADDFVAIPALGGFARPLLFPRLALARPLQLRCFTLLGREIPNGEIVERNLVPRPLAELHEVLERSDHLGREVHPVAVRVAGHADDEAALIDVLVDEVQLGVAGRTFKVLIGGTINAKRILTHWDETLRLVTSIKHGTVTPSLMLRKLSSYPRQNGLAVALREIGQIQRTLFTLDGCRTSSCAGASMPGSTKARRHRHL